MKLYNVPTHRFNEIVKKLREAGWNKVEEYDGFDAWIDYGLIVLRRDVEEVRCEWTNWEEGSFEGSKKTLESPIFQNVSVGP